MASLYKQKLSRQWWVKYRDPESRLIIRQSLKTRDKGVGRLRLRKYVQLEAGGKLEPADLPALLAQWQDYRALVGSPRQAGRNIVIWQRFLAVCGVVEVEQITRGAIEQYMVQASQTLTAKTVKNHLSAISSFCRWLCDHDLIDRVPRVAPPKVKHLPPRFLSPAQVDEVLALAQADPTTYTLVLIALKTGLRLDEMRKMAWEDIHWRERLIVVPESKSNRPRSVPLHPELATHLKTIAKPKGLVFASPQGGCYDRYYFYRLMDPIRKVMPVFTDGVGRKATGRCFHLLRYTFASRAVQAGVDIYKVSKWLGHSSVNTTQRYAHLAPAHDDDIALV